MRALSPRSLMRWRTLIPASVAVVALVLAGTAWAYWTSSGSGTGAATVGTLNAPTGVAATSTAGTGTVSVSWTAAGSPGSVSYFVTRSTGGTSVAACATSASSTTTATSCSDQLVPLGTYSYRVTAVYHSWTAQSSPSPDVSVAQASQSITFTSTSPASAAVGGGYTVTATGGGSGKPVLFSTTTTSTCTLSGSAVTFLHPGTCTIDADQASSTYYSAAPTAHQSTSVGKAPQLIGFTSSAPTAATVGGTGYTPTASGGASGNPVVLTIDASTSNVCGIASGTVTYQHAGTCIVDANQAGNSDYQAANQVQQAIAVGKGSQAVNITSTAPASAQVGGTYTPVASSSAGLSVTIALGASSSGCSLSGGVVTFDGAGTCVVVASQPGNADYLAAAPVQQSFAIAQKSQSITFTSTAPTAAVVNGTYAASATASSNLTVTFSSATPSVCTNAGATFTFVGVGSCTVNADQAGNSVYSPAPTASQTFSVAAAATKFAVSVATPQTAGTSFAVTITAQDASSNTVTSYAGSHSITLTSTAGTSPSGAAPTLPSGSATFTNGIATVSGVILVKAEGGRTISASDGSIFGTSSSVTVSAAAAATLSVGASTTSITAGGTTNLTLTAKDAYGNVATGYAGSKSVTFSGASTSPGGNVPTVTNSSGTAIPFGTATALTFTAGVSSVSGASNGVATLYAAETSAIKVSDDSSTSAATSVAVTPAAAAKLGWSGVSVSGGTLASSCLFVCTDTNLGSKGTFTALVSVTDSWGNLVSNVGAGHSVQVATPGSGAGSGGSFTAPTSGNSVSLTISATGPAQSTASFVFKAQSGNNSWVNTFTATSSAGTTYGAASATVTN